MNFDDLRIFITLGKFKNFTKTAEECHIVQSTVSNRIKKLEEYIGVKLFVRDNKTVELTNSGKQFLVFAKRLVSIQSSAISELNALKTFDGILNIGTVHAIYDSFVNELILNFVDNCTSISTNIIISHSNELFQKLHDDLLDIAFTYYEINSSKFLNIPLTTDELILITNPTNKTYIEGIYTTELKKIPIIYSDIVLMSSPILSKDIFSDDYVYQLHINILSKVFSFLEKGIGYCFLPRSLVSEKLKNGTLIEIELLDSPPLILQIYMIVNKKNIHSMAVRKWFSMNFPNSHYL